MQVSISNLYKKTIDLTCTLPLDDLRIISNLYKKTIDFYFHFPLNTFIMNFKPL